MEMLEDHALDCPYCGEPISVGVDCSAGSQDFIEDCTICCSPIEFHAEVDGDGQLLRLTARRDDE
jgi:hypothetical protein